MFDSDEELLSSRFGASRPGLTLVKIVPAALPVTLVTTDVLAQERKPLALMNEFVLRFCDAGLSTTTEIALMCGLEEKLVEETAAEEVSAGNLSYASANRALALTPAGQRMCQDLGAILPVQKSLPIAFDRLVWRVADHRPADVVTKREAEQRGYLLLPASRTTRIGAEDVTAPAVNGLLRGRGGQQSVVEVLAVRRIRPDTHRYLPVQLLVYADAAGQEVELAVVVDGEHSEPHDLALAALGGAAALGIRVERPDELPELAPEIDALKAAEDPGEAALVVPVDGMVEPRTDTSRLRSIGVFEHARLLREALDGAARRLLIIAPWVKSAVVDKAFVDLLERRLRAGVTVHLAHGIGRNDGGSDAEALARLTSLQERHPEKFVLARLANSHAKILIFDDTWVSTSFNWLSFKGDPERTYRMEEGILVRIPDRVSKAYHLYVAQIAEQRIS